MSDPDQLPDGVERDRDVNEYGVEYGLWTRIEGHGRVEEQYAVLLPDSPALVYADRAAAIRQANYFFDTGQVRDLPPVRRVVVIEME